MKHIDAQIERFEQEKIVIEGCIQTLRMEKWKMEMEGFKLNNTNKKEDKPKWKNNKKQ